MPQRQELKKVMIIGAGPTVIGQGGEYDAAAVQACRALRELGCAIVMINPDPASMATDPGVGDATYLEPLNVDVLREIIETEQPDALLASLGGQTALNLCRELAETGVLAECGVELLGSPLAAIAGSEDHQAFKEMLKRLGFDALAGQVAKNAEEAEEIAARFNYPVVIRSFDSTAGVGARTVYNAEYLRDAVERSLAVGQAGRLLVEESALDWEEWQLEAMRDAEGRTITICGIENVDALGVHSGDSQCTIPWLTVAPELQQRMQREAEAILAEFKVVGPAGIRFAHNPTSGRLVVISADFRITRTSTLASRATGFPIAAATAMLAVGLSLAEIPCPRCGSLGEFTPLADSVTVKLLRWSLRKLPGARDRLGPEMHSEGEAIGVGSTYKEALQKAVRSLAIGRCGLGFAKDFNEIQLPPLMKLLVKPSAERLFVVYEALRKGAALDELEHCTHFKRWHLEQLQELVELEEELRKYQGVVPPVELLRRAKKDGFADHRLARLCGVGEREIRSARQQAGIVRNWAATPAAGGEKTACLHSTFHEPQTTAPAPSAKRKLIVLGGGPNYIGQGSEFDHCCANAARAICNEPDSESIMVNCNPLSVSTARGIVDKVYFEPLAAEDVLAICEREQPEGVIAQFGGPTALKVARELAEAGVRVLGASPEAAAVAENHVRLRQAAQEWGMPQPEFGMAGSLAEALEVAERMGYPVMVRPAVPFSDELMATLQDEDSLREYFTHTEATPEHPLPIEKFLENASEVEVNALADGEGAHLPAIIEHIELAGVHSGDSACVIPPVGAPLKHLETVGEYVQQIARELRTVGLLNVKCAIADDVVYLLEVNLRASRTVPFVSKVCNLPLARLATQLILGKRLGDLDLKQQALGHFGVREAVFPFDRHPDVDPLLGPEMRSTGAALGLADSFGLAFFKAQESAGQSLPCQGGAVLLTVADGDKPAALEIAKQLVNLGFELKATDGTQQFLAERGVAAEAIDKMHEGRPNIADGIKNKEIQLVINTPAGKQSKHDDSFIRKAAVKYHTPVITNLSAVAAAVKGIAARRQGSARVRSLQDYHSA